MNERAAAAGDAAAGQGAAEEPVKDSVAKVNDEVAVGEDLAFQRSWWKFERLVWLFFGAFLIAALLGAFGRGPVAKGTLESDDGLIKVSYERIERTGTPSMMTLTLAAKAIHDGVAVVSVSDEIIDELGAQRVIPQPTNTTLDKGGVTYTFPVQSSPATVRIELQPKGPGFFKFAVGIAGAPLLDGNTFVVP